MAFLFFTSAFFLEYDSINNIIYKVKPMKNTTFIIIGFIQAFIYLLITIYKVFLANQLVMNTLLMADVINSLLNGIFIVSTSFSMIIFDWYSVWYFSYIFGIIIGLLMFAYSCFLFVKRFFTKFSDIPKE